jgi:hypothetical protein
MTGCVPPSTVKRLHGEPDARRSSNPLSRDLAPRIVQPRGVDGIGRAERAADHDLVALDPRLAAAIGRDPRPRYNYSDLIRRRRVRHENQSEPVAIATAMVAGGFCLQRFTTVLREVPLNFVALLGH